MRRVNWDELTASERAQVLARPSLRASASVSELVSDIFARMEREGEAAFNEIALRYDGARPTVLRLTKKVIDSARRALDRRDLDALEVAKANIKLFHEATKPQDISVTVAPGVICRRVYRPIGAAGVYVPGGTAPLVSTLMMLAIPARVAGVDNIIAVTPPDAQGGAHPAMIAAAAMCGLETLHLAGGAQAIAALAYGVAPLLKADKIFGPGNAYVAAAKTYAAALPGGPAIDLPAGPSELMVIADGGADPEIVAADLLGQAEHDRAAQVLLISTDAALAQAVGMALEIQAAQTPRAEIVAQSLAHGRIIVVSAIADAIDIANAYAPEHLSLQIANASDYVSRIKCAGAVFVGPWAAETFGDYVCGPSHVLPTDGAARAWGGVGVASFMTSMSVQELSQEGAGNLGEAAFRLAALEGLSAHGAAVSRRLPRLLSQMRPA